MKIIVLAAGRGSRLGERTKDRPKCMCEFNGRSLLNRCMESLAQAGIQRDDIGIVTGYRSELFDLPDITLFHNANWENTNMFCSLLEAEAWLQQEPCIVCYSDIVFSPKAIEALVLCQSPLALTYYTGFWELWCARMEDPLSDLETFKLDADGKLLEIGKKPQSRSDIQGQYMGLIRFTPESWKWVRETIQKPLPKPVQKLDMTTLLQGMLDQGHPIQTIATDDLWLECDTQQDIEVYEKLFPTFK